MTTYLDTAHGLLAYRALNPTAFEAEPDIDFLVDSPVLENPTDHLIKKRYYTQGSFHVATCIRPLNAARSQAASETSGLSNFEVKFLGKVEFKDNSSLNASNSFEAAVTDSYLTFDPSQWDKAEDQENVIDAEQSAKFDVDLPLTISLGREPTFSPREESRDQTQRLLVEFLTSHARARAMYMPSVEKIWVESDVVFTTADTASVKLAGLKAPQHYQALTKAPREGSGTERVFVDSWLTRYSKLVEQLSLLKADWDGEDSVVPSTEVVRAVARVARYLPAQTRNPEVEIDSSTGTVNLNWWSKDFRDCFSLVFVQPEFVIGITSSGDSAPVSWRHSIEDQRRISEEFESSTFAQKLIGAS